MMNVRRSLPALLLVVLSAGLAARGAEPVAASVESSLATHEGQIRQFVFDGDETSFFLSERSPTDKDSFTIVLEKPVTLKSVFAKSGRPDGSAKIEGGTLETSTDGREFRKLASFEKGNARGGPVADPIRAIRIKFDAASAPIAVREFSIVSEPPIAVFRYPVEFLVDVVDAPEMKEWAEKVARTCERSYPMINEELASDGFKPPHLIRMKLSKAYRGVAGTSRDHITGSVDYFKRRPQDVGAMVHETVHVVQAYRRGPRPGWLVEGVSDYIRFFKFEPGKLGRINPSTAHYDGSYRVSAAFLAYLVENYDKDIVRKLNAAMREGRYDDNLIEQITGKTQGMLDDEWRATLRPAS